MNDLPNDTTWQARWGEKALSKGVTAIPTAFLLHAARSGLNHAQQVLLIHLVSYWWQASRDPFPSLKELKNRTGMSEKTISKHLKALEEKKWLGRKRRYNNSYRYDLDRLSRRVAYLASDEGANEQQAPPERIANPLHPPAPMKERSIVEPPKPPKEKLEPPKPPKEKKDSSDRENQGFMERSIKEIMRDLTEKGE